MMSNDPVADRMRLARRIRIAGFCVGLPTAVLAIAVLVMAVRGQSGHAAWPWVDIMGLGMAVTLALGQWLRIVLERASGELRSRPTQVIVLIAIAVLLIGSVVGLVWH